MSYLGLLKASKKLWCIMWFTGAGAWLLGLEWASKACNARRMPVIHLNYTMPYSPQSSLTYSHLIRREILEDSYYYPHL